MTARAGTGAALLATLGMAGAAHAAVCPVGQDSKSCHSTAPSVEQSGSGAALTVLSGLAPIAWQSGGVDIAAGEPSTLESFPGLRSTLSGGLWGNDGAEPIALAVADFDYFPAAGVDYLAPPSEGDSYVYACELGEPLCIAYGGGSQYRRIRENAGAFMQRRYRIVKVNPATLPAAVKSVPVLVDYAMSFFGQGEQELEVGTRPAINHSGMVEFGHFFTLQTTVMFSGQKVNCGSTPTGNSCFETLVNGSTEPGTMTGTLARDVQLSLLDALALRIEAIASHSAAPECRDQPEPGEDCLIKPWKGSGHTVVDPYVYIDPAFQYADWFELQMSADETDTTWVTPQRTAIDPDTMTLLDGVGGANGVGGQGSSSDGGQGGAMNGAAGATPGSAGEDALPSNGGVPSDVPEPGTAGEEQGGSSTVDDSPNDPGDGDDGCGCRVVAPQPHGWALSLLLAGAAALALRRRRG